MNKLWSEDKKRKNAEKIISEILPYVKENGIAYSSIITIAIRELGASASNGLKENLILETLVKVKSENQSSVDHFERTYREVEAKWKKRLNMEASTWDLLIPFDIKIRKRKLKLLKTEFIIRSKPSLRKEYQQSVFAFGANRNFTVEALPDFSIQTKVKALDIYRAWEKIEGIYDLLRGITDFATNVHQWQILSPDRKRTKVETPRLVLGSSDKGEMKTLTFFNDSQQQFTSLELNKKQENSFSALISLFANKKIEDGSIDDLIADSLRLYAQAMDSIFDYNCFLSLWQMAERMCCSSFFKGSTEEVVKRLKCHSHRFNLIGSGYIHVLGKLADKRNALVHRGIHNQIEAEDINILKIICEIVLKWIIDERKNLKTEMQLNEFYKFYKLRNEDGQKLVAMKDAILFVEKNR